MTILITGGTGQLGSELQRIFLASSTPFIALSRQILDLQNTSAIKSLLTKIINSNNVTAIIHTAAQTGVDLAESNIAETHRLNVTATSEIAKVCEASKIPLVYLSTDYVFSGSKTKPYEIDDLTGPLNVYGTTKLAGENGVRQVAEKHYVVRTSWVYNQSGTNFPKSILKATSENRPLKVVIDQTGSPTFAGDLAEAISVLLGLHVKTQGIQFEDGYQSPAPYGTYHVTNDGFCTWYEFATEILRQSGWESKIEATDSSQLTRPAVRPKYSVLSDSSIRELGWSLRHWKDGLGSFLTDLRIARPDLFQKHSINAG